jgi:hypothetical protein
MACLPLLSEKHKWPIRSSLSRAQGDEGMIELDLPGIFWYSKEKEKSAYEKIRH